MRFIESSREDEIRIARNGHLVVKMTLINAISASKRIGIAEGKFEVPDDLDAGSEDIAAAMLQRRRC